MALTDNLIAYWNLDESSGNASDSVSGGTTNTLVNTNTVTYSAGKINNGANFAKASSQYFLITNANQTGLAITGDISFAGWLNLASLPANLNIYGLVSRLVSSQGYSLGYYREDNGDFGAGTRYVFFVNYYDGSSNRTFGGGLSTLSTSTWYHVAVTIAVASQTIIVYVNGSSVTYVPILTNASSIGNPSAEFDVGKHPFGTGTYLDGSMDEWGIWSRVLSASEVTSLYNGGSGISYPFTTPSSVVSSANHWLLMGV